MSRRPFKWTAKQLDKLNKVKVVLDELREYKPLTLRQIYYQLVGKDYIENNKSQYTMLSGLLKWARIEGHIGWDDIEDRVRVFHNGAGWSNNEQFIEQELRNFLAGYKRDLLQTQDKYIEIWIEKDALSSIFKRVTLPYCISTVVCRGFNSVSFLNDFKNRLVNYEDKEPVMLYFGDFDPSGVEMLESIETTLIDELGVNSLEFKRVALTEEDIYKYKLPHNPDALKKTDTRAKKHLEAFGELAVELDALKPDVLEQKIRDAIERELDVNTFEAELKNYRDEIKHLDKLKNKVGILIEAEL